MDCCQSGGHGILHVIDMMDRSDTSLVIYAFMKGNSPIVDPSVGGACHSKSNPEGKTKENVCFLAFG